MADAAPGFHFLARKNLNMMESGSSIAIIPQKACIKCRRPNLTKASRAVAVSRSARTRSFSASDLGVSFTISSLDLLLDPWDEEEDPSWGAAATKSRKVC